MANGTQSTSLGTRSGGWADQGRRAMILRAGLLGLCLGLVIIGLLENVNRFGSPQAQRSDARIEARQTSQNSILGAAHPNKATRADQLAMPEATIATLHTSVH